MRRIAKLLAAAVMMIAFASSAVMSAPREKGASTWVLQKGRDVPETRPRKPTLRMQGDQLSGSTGCNNYTATIMRRAEQRIAIEQVALTRMLCEPQANAVEKAVVGAMRQTEFMDQQGSTLTFQAGDKSPLLVWTRQQASSGQRQAGRRVVQARSVKRKRTAHHRKATRHRTVVQHRRIVRHRTSAGHSRMGRHRKVAYRAHCLWWH